MKKRLQVFISSTYKDLIVERQAAVSAILKLGHIPAGMELFTANDKSQWDTIKRWIDESDVYMLILGGRYGSVDSETNLSYTELEYDYAVEIGKPLFATVINNSALEKKVHEGGTGFIERENPKALELFKSKVLKNMSSFWDDDKDIIISVLESLPQINSERNLVGWVQGSDVPDVKTLVDEISSLKQENARLQIQLKTHLAQPIKEESMQDIEFKELKKYFLNQKFILPKENITEENDNGERSLHRIFLILITSLVTGITVVGSESAAQWFSKEIFPELELCDLVKWEYEKDTGNKVYYLTEKGKLFAIFLRKNIGSINS